MKKHYSPALIYSAVLFVLAKKNKLIKLPGMEVD